MGKVLFKGNEALAEAALAAGCRFYSGYPITPQTEILEYLSWRMEDVGGVFIQAESELAGVNMVLGASAQAWEILPRGREITGSSQEAAVTAIITHWYWHLRLSRKMQI